MAISDGLREPIRLRPNMPVAIQVANHLRGRLRRDFSSGGQLPSENLIAAALGVSRGTVRQALAILQHEGLISRRQGRGTFANPNVAGIPARIDFAYEFTELITAAGYVAGVKTLDKCPDRASAETANRLGLARGAPTLNLRKVFLASGQPAIYEADILPTDLIVEDYDPAELDLPIWHFLERRCRRRIKHVLSELVPCVADSALAELLQVQAGSPTLKFLEVFYDVKNEPLVLAHIYFREPMIRFHALRRVTPVI